MSTKIEITLFIRLYLHIQVKLSFGNFAVFWLQCMSVLFTDSMSEYWRKPSYMISEATFTALKQSQNQFGWKEGQRVCFFMANIFNRSSAQSSLSQKHLQWTNKKNKCHPLKKIQKATLITFIRQQDILEGARLDKQWVCKVRNLIDHRPTVYQWL